MKRNVRKYVSAMLMVLLVAMFFTAAIYGAAKSQGVVHVKHWVWLDNPNDPTFSNMVKEFNATHPNIHVDLEIVPWGDYHNKLLVAAAGGGLPDTSAFKLTWVPEFTGMKVLTPLDRYAKSWKGYKDIQSNLWDVYKVTNDNKLYVMPWEVQVLYMYYRPSLFKKAGVTIPETWDQFLEVAKKLTVDTDGDGKIDQYGYGMRGARYGHEPWGSFVFAYVKGNKIMDKGKVAFDTPEVEKANQFFIDLYRKYKVVPPTAPRDGFAEIIANFKSGRTAMVIHHVKSSPDMIKQFGDDVAAFPVPAGKYGRWTSMGDTDNVLFSTSKHKKEAFTFISWLAEKDQIDKWCRASGNVPVVKSVQQMSYYQNNRFMKVSFESMPFAHVYPVNSAMGEWIESVWPATMQRALEGQISSKQVIKELAAAMVKK
ncbi:MAG TPA: sugar ABC transporter substrate-binding protein [Bacillota bacterium]